MFSFKLYAIYSCSNVEFSFCSLFIKSGYPAFGLVNNLYHANDQIRRLQETVETQSQLLQSMRDLQQEYQLSATTSQNISVSSML